MKVSILINNYNYGQYLDYCIQSTINQTYKDIEVIFYDDGSTDNSLSVAQKYKENIHILAKPNHGKYASFNQANAVNQAFEVSTGEIVCLLDSDDAFDKNKVETVVKVFADNPDVICVQHKMNEIDTFNNRTGNVQKNIICNVNQQKGIYFSNRLDSFFMQTSGLSFRRSYLEKVLPLQQDNYPLIWADVRLSRSAVFYGEIHTIPYSLGEYRVHSNNDSLVRQKKEVSQQFESQLYAFFEELSLKSRGKRFQRRNKIISTLQLFLVCLMSKDSTQQKFRFIYDKLISIIANKL